MLLYSEVLSVQILHLGNHFFNKCLEATRWWSDMPDLQLIDDLRL